MVRLNDRPDMPVIAYRGRKTTIQQQEKLQRQKMMLSSPVIMHRNISVSVTLGYVNLYLLNSVQKKKMFQQERLLGRLVKLSPLTQSGEVNACVNCKAEKRGVKFCKGRLLYLLPVSIWFCAMIQ